ncbi:MAG: hypothetical protein VX341_08745, partial [Bdellovibrionota bacterium]|nr:hypothetical protein [Bdellovibrionota bacterium]
KIKLSEKVNEKLQEIDRETSRLLFQSYIDLHNSFYEELSISYSQYDQDLSTRGLYSKTFEYPHIDMTFLDVEDEDTHLRFCQKYGFNKVSDFKSRTVNSVCYHPLSRDKDERVNHLISGENVINIKYYEKCIPILTDINSLDGIETQKFEVLEKITCENSQNVGEKIGSFIDKFNIDERHFDKQSDSDNQSLKSNQKTSDNSSGVRR